MEGCAVEVKGGHGFQNKFGLLSLVIREQIRSRLETDVGSWVLVTDENSVWALKKPGFTVTTQDSLAWLQT